MTPLVPRSESPFDARLKVYSTCPPSSAWEGRDYLGEVRRTSAWSEAAGCHGALVYADNSLVDPWILSHALIDRTTSLRPLIALQPISMHPYAAAKMIASFGTLYGRGVDVNLVAGGFKNDLTALGDGTPHDRRYDRLVEYASILRGLLRGVAPVTQTGEFYQVERLRLAPPLPPQLFPNFLISGSSDAGLEAARALGATAVHYPKPAREYTRPVPDGEAHGIRIGILARPTDEEAWETALLRFPEDRRGQLAHELAMQVSDSSWHAQLSRMADAPEASGYWLRPFKNYKTMCPYLVGSYDRVAEEVGRYLALGFRTFILDIPREPDDLMHTGRAFRLALDQCPSPSLIG